MINKLLPSEEFGHLFSHLKNLLLSHETKPVRHSKNARVVEPVNPVKYINIYLM